VIFNEKLMAPEPQSPSPGDVLDLLYDVVRKPPVADKASATHCLVAAALIKLVTRCPGESEKIKTLGESRTGDSSIIYWKTIGKP
jgi:hypothetical protein